MPGWHGVVGMMRAAVVPPVSGLFNASLWAGNGANRSITTGVDLTGEGLVFIKSRGASAQWYVFDKLRGTGNYLLFSSTAAQAADSSTLTAFNNNGFSLGTDAAAGGYVNTSGHNYVGYSFKTAPKFFDVVTYAGNGTAGRLIPHNLGQVPGLVITKQTSATNDWAIWHNSLSSGNHILLTATAETTTNATVTYGNGTVTVPPDANNVTVGTATYVNGNTHSYVMYLFGHDPSGNIACGSYVGNGSATGPIVTLGWEPQFVMIKARNQGQGWAVFDQARGIPVGNDPTLQLQTFVAETTTPDYIDVSSTGFQIKNTAALLNTSGQTYLYMAVRK